MINATQDYNEVKENKPKFKFQTKYFRTLTALALVSSSTRVDLRASSILSPSCTPPVPPLEASHEHEGKDKQLDIFIFLMSYFEH